jgi:uncharacterized protein YndB with AHSA1/START domain
MTYATPDDTVFITRLFNAGIGILWKTWTEPELILKWFGSDPEGTGISARMDVQPGGEFEIGFRNSDGTVFYCHGIYSFVEAPRELRFSWEWKNEPGVISQVSVSFSPAQGATMMEFIHSGVGTKSAHNYKMGWNSTFEKLEKILGSLN